MGNSLIAVWPRGYVGKYGDAVSENVMLKKDRTDEDSDIIVGRKAVQCALEIK